MEIIMDNLSKEELKKLLKKMDETGCHDFNKFRIANGNWIKKEKEDRVKK